MQRSFVGGFRAWGLDGFGVVGAAVPILLQTVNPQVANI